MTDRTALLCVLVTLAACCLPVLGQGSEPAATHQESASAIETAAPRELEALLRQVPKNRAEIDARSAIATARMEDLLPATQELEQPLDESAARERSLRAELHRAWEAYAAALKRLAMLQERGASITSEAYVQKVAEELAAIEQENVRLRSQSIPDWPTEEQVASVRARDEEVESRIAALSDTQGRRTAQLAGGFARQREQLDDELKKLRQQRRGAGEAPPEGEEPPPEAGQPPFSPPEQRRIAVQVATIEIQLHALQLDEQQTALLAKQEERTLAALRTLSDVLTRRLTTLNQARSRTRLEILELRQQRAETPVERAQIELEMLYERLLRFHAEPSQRDATAEKRAATQSLERLKEQIALSRVYWERVVETLAHAAGDARAALEQRARSDERRFEDDLGALRENLAHALSETGKAESIRERATRRFDELGEEVRTWAESLDTAAVTRIDTEVSALRAKLDEALRGTVDDRKQATETLDGAIELTETYLAELRGHAQRIYWERVFGRDSGLFRTDWARAGAEMRQLFGSLGGVPTPPPGTERSTGDPLDAILGVEPPESAVPETWRSAGRALRGVSPRAWGWALGASAVGAVLGYLIRRWGLRRRGRLVPAVHPPHTARHGEAPSVTEGISDRIDLMGWNLVCDLSPLLLPAAALGVVGYRALPPGPARTAAAAVWAIPVVGVMLWRLAHHVFEAEHPAHRPLPCDDHTARHYRQWLAGAILFSAVALPVPIVLTVLETAPSLRAVMLEIYKIGLLGLLQGFLLARDRVLGVVTRGGFRWSSMVAAMLYPIVVLAVLGLFTLQTIGYGALVSYVGSGVLLTVGAIFGIAITVEYLVDVMDRYAARTRRSHRRAESVAGWGRTGGEEAETASKARPTAPAGGTESTATSEEILGVQRGHFLLTMFKALLRLAALAAMAAVVLRVWNIPLEGGWLNFRTLGLGGVVILAALVLDRILWTATSALSTSGRVPRSTTNLIQRWARTALLVVVALTIIAINGWQVDSLWSFLTTLLAMVAIGFVAVWSVLSNILATFIILVWRPFNVGEHIEILPEAIEGQVVDINFMYTTLRTEQGGKMAVPNNLFTQKFISRKLLRGEPQRSLAEQLVAQAPLGE
jgi:hypothetical protein